MSKPTIEQLRDPDYLLYYWELEDGPEDFIDESGMVRSDVPASLDVCRANGSTPCNVCRSSGWNKCKDGE